jgi:hypothetical protein
MLFMCHGTPRPGLTSEDRQKVLQIFTGWRPPAGMEIKAHYVSATGCDYVVVETESVNALIEATAMWAPYVSYEVAPIVAVADGVGSIERAEVARRALV